MQASDFILADGPGIENPLRILVVDDVRDIADALADVLQLSGYESAAAYSAQGAVASVEQFHPNAILLDLRLPGTNGLDLARALRSQPHLAGIMIVAMTGEPSDELRDAALAAGSDHFLAKPVSLRHIYRLIGNPRGDRPAGAGL